MFQIIATALCAVLVIGYILYSANGQQESPGAGKTASYPEVGPNKAA